MDRNEEYKDLLIELDNYPTKLNTTLDRVRTKRKKKLRRFFIVPLTFVASLVVIFISMVNHSTSFAFACGQIPVIDVLAKLTTFSPSLKAAIDNEYVQPINQEQTKADMTVRVEYVIVDQKQLNVFYSFISKENPKLSVTPVLKDVNGNPINSVVISTSNFERSINLITIDFFDKDIPDSLQLSFEVRPSEYHEASISGKELLNLYKDPIYPKIIETFRFDLTFDPFYTSQGENVELNHSFNLDNEVLKIEDVEIYPTHMRVNFSDIETNTAWMEGLSFYVENEKGEKFERSSNGITAIGSPDSPMMGTYFLESSFFSDSKELTLYITGVTWLDKNMKRMKLDLANVTAEALPEGVTFESATRHGNSWTLTFVAKLMDGMTQHQIWNSTYYDESGKDYRYDKWSSSAIFQLDSDTNVKEGVPEAYRMNIPLVNYKYDIVYLEPVSTRQVELLNPIALKIK